MIKPYHLLLTILLTSGIWVLVLTCTNSKEELPDPEIHRLKEEIGWREFKEAKIKDTLKFERQEKHILAKENVSLRTKAERAEAKFNQHHLNSFLKKLGPSSDSIIRAGGSLTTGTILKTDNDKIEFLIEDTTLCDSALLRSKELVQGLNIEVETDDAIIKGQGELIDSLQEDKKDLLKVDSLNQIDKKKLRKANRKKFFRGLGIGGALGAIIMALLL